MNSLWTVLSGSLLAGIVIIPVVGIMVYLIRTWLAERIRQSITHDFDRRLEEYRNELNQLASKYNSIQSAANATMIEGQKVAAEFRIRAADEMWREILRLREATNYPLTMLDLLDPSEYQQIVTNCHIQSITLKADTKTVLANPGIEHIRPFVGERLFALLFSYRAIVGGIWVALEEDIKRGHVTPWFHNTHICQLLRQVLTGEEMKHFEGLTSLRVNWTRNLIEEKILRHLRDLIAGTHSVDEGLEQAGRINKAVTELERSQTT